MIRLRHLSGLLAIAVSLALFETSTATLGVDISGATCNSAAPPSGWSCLVKNGYSFAIIQAWQGGYHFTNNIHNCINQAWAAGMKHVDVYIFMCPNCRNNNPENAVETVVNALRGNRTNFGMLWFDVEQCDGCWNDAASNAAWIMRGVKQAQSMGVNIGIYSNLNEWRMTVGDSNAFSNLPLWYAHYDGQPNFSDSYYYHFGGWTKPAMKQFNDKGPCMNVDVSWYP